MANLIDNSYFIREINLPSDKITGNLEDISKYITKYEPEILLKLLGYDLYKALKVQIDSGSPYAAPWKDFIEGAEYKVGDYTVKWPDCLLYLFLLYAGSYHLYKNNR
jgi:hypothetical protein